MQINITYFASLREQAHTTQETLEADELKGVTTLSELYDHLKARHGFSLDRSHLRAAVNDEFVDWSKGLKDGDLVVFIPPVSGG